ncbi:vWA domain-containing protein [Arsukibacterium sp.]|uniref:vWA domain-containing protein n=1 Tax=Arsukibacterium sp. TaxID=1977258 RepID=UPI002FD96CE2
MLADIHLLRPWWLLSILPALLLWLLIWRFRQHNSGWQQLIAPHLQSLLLNGQQLQQRQPLALPMLALCWCLTALALSGPSWQQLPQPVLTSKTATVLVMDMSMSMRATDMVPDRLTQQRFKALDLVDAITEGDLALISFAADAFVISPLTPDHNNVRLQIPALLPEIMPAQGSNVLAALNQANELLLQAGYPSGHVVLFADGFDPNSYQPILDLLNRWPHRLSILAFGTTEGAVVRMDNGELLKNAQGGVVIPRVPLEQLQQLARRGGGHFATASPDNSDLTHLLNTRTASALTEQASEALTGDQWQDNAIYLVWLLLPLALYLAKRAPVLLILPFAYLPSAEAFSWRDLWQSRQQQAAEAYQQQDYVRAEQAFTDPQWQGHAAYRHGNYQQAEQHYRTALQQQRSADNLHNLGNALALQQRFAEALDSYQQALELAPEHAAAQQNALIMQQLLEQQEQQQSSSDQQQSQQQDQQSEQQEEQQSSDEADQQNSENSSEQQSDEQDSEDQQPSSAQPQQPDEQQNAADEQQQQEMQALTEQDDAAMPEPEREQQAAIRETWPNATPEQQQELDNLLRKVQDDPGLLLRNRMYLENQKRRQHNAPPGVVQEW